MRYEALILNSGEWVLAEELPAAPWHVLVYAQRGAPRNQLHVWLPRRDVRSSGEFVFRRYWEVHCTRWCVEVPSGSGKQTIPGAAVPRVRFSAPDGRVLWSENPDGRGLGDLSDDDLARLLLAGYAASYSGH